jgi:hypothetical protein
MQGNPEPVDRTDAYGQPVETAPPPVPQGQDNAPPPPQMGQRPYGVPAQITLKSGAYVTVLINNLLSTDHNQLGDTFTGTLVQPLVADGIVIAERGQLVYGRVMDVQKQHADRSSRLGLQLTSITLADGSQAPVSSQMLSRKGTSTPAGVQAGTVVGTSAVGAAIGGVAAWGTGAAIGAGAGAVAGIIGVLATRNHPSVIYPETALTFQVLSPIQVSTSHAPQAFHYVGPGDYNQGPPQQRLQPRMAGPGPGPGYGYAPGYYPPPYPYPYYGSYWGPSFGFVVGPGFYYGRGFYRRWR